MTVIYHEADGDIGYLDGKTIGIIGYGNLGRPIALNLRDSGVQLVVGVRSGEAQEAAQADGLRVLPIEQLVQETQIIMLLLPDEVMSEVYLEKVSPYLAKGDTLIFSSGYNIAFGYIEAPPFVDVGLIAPRTFGAAVRERYEMGQSFYSFVAVGQDASGTSWQTVLAVAAAIGTLRAGAIEVSIEQEAELDLFIQQAIRPTLHNLLMTASNLLIRMGYPPEAVLAELYISEEFTDYINQAAQAGLLHALRLTAITAQYGTLSRQERFNELKLERLMEITLDEIRSGDFAQEWAKEYADGYPRLLKLQTSLERRDLWELEQQALDLLRRFY